MNLLNQIFDKINKPVEEQDDLGGDWVPGSYDHIDSLEGHLPKFVREFGVARAATITRVTREERKLQNAGLDNSPELATDEEWDDDDDNSSKASARTAASVFRSNTNKFKVVNDDTDASEYPDVDSLKRDSYISHIMNLPSDRLWQRIIKASIISNRMPGVQISINSIGLFTSYPGASTAFDRCDKFKEAVKVRNEIRDELLALGGDGIIDVIREEMREDFFVWLKNNMSRLRPDSIDRLQREVLRNIADLASCVSLTEEELIDNLQPIIDVCRWNTGKNIKEMLFERTDFTNGSCSLGQDPTLDGDNVNANIPVAWGVIPMSTILGCASMVDASDDDNLKLMKLVQELFERVETAGCKFHSEYFCPGQTRRDPWSVMTTFFGRMISNDSNQSVLRTSGRHLFELGKTIGFDKTLFNIIERLFKTRWDTSDNDMVCYHMDLAKGEVTLGLGDGFFTYTNGWITGARDSAPRWNSQRDNLALLVLFFEQLKIKAHIQLKRIPTTASYGASSKQFTPEEMADMFVMSTTGNPRAIASMENFQIIPAGPLTDRTSFQSAGQVASGHDRNDTWDGRVTYFFLDEYVDMTIEGHKINFGKKVFGPRLLWKMMINHFLSNSQDEDDSAAFRIISITRKSKAWRIANLLALESAVVDGYKFSDAYTDYHHVKKNLKQMKALVAGRESDLKDCAKKFDYVNEKFVDIINWKRVFKAGRVQCNSEVVPMARALGLTDEQVKVVENMYMESIYDMKRYPMHAIGRESAMDYTIMARTLHLNESILAMDPNYIRTCREYIAELGGTNSYRYDLVLPALDDELDRAIRFCSSIMWVGVLSSATTTEDKEFVRDWISSQDLGFMGKYARYFHTSVNTGERMSKTYFANFIVRRGFGESDYAQFKAHNASHMTWAVGCLADEIEECNDDIQGIVIDLFKNNFANLKDNLPEVYLMILFGYTAMVTGTDMAEAVDSHGYVDSWVRYVRQYITVADRNAPGRGTEFIKFIQDEIASMDTSNQAVNEIQMAFALEFTHLT